MEKTTNHVFHSLHYLWKVSLGNFYFVTSFYLGGFSLSFLKKYLFIYLAALGLSCGMPDL